MKKITISKAQNLTVVQNQSLSNSYKAAFEEAAQQQGIKILNMLKIIEQLSQSYVVRFDNAWNKFLSQNHIIKAIRTLPTSSNYQNKEDGQQRQVIERERYRNNKQATLELIAVLEEGRQLLQLIRQNLTGQTLATEITYIDKNSGDIYRIPQNLVSDYLTPVLTTYNAGVQTNPLNLAYEINNIIQFQKTLQEYGTKLNSAENDIYNQIWEIKEPYLIKYKHFSADQARQKKIFNSKDAEIYDLMSQKELQSPGSTKGWLNVEQYAKLRATLGGGGGLATTQLQSGDIGLIQDKLLASNQMQVNVTRYSMIKLKFSDIIKLLQTQNINTIKEGLQKIFLINEQKNLNEITVQTNKTATKFFNDLFKEFS